MMGLFFSSSKLMTTDVDESHTSSLLFNLTLFILFVKLRHNYIVFSLPVRPPIPPIYHPPYSLSNQGIFFFNC